MTDTINGGEENLRGPAGVNTYLKLADRYYKGPRPGAQGEIPNVPAVAEGAQSPSGEGVNVEPTGYQRLSAQRSASHAGAVQAGRDNGSGERRR